MSHLQPGERIADRYVIAEQIGEGGMGVVYSAQDEKLRRSVAVKVLSAKQVGNKGARSRLKREARAAAAFAHPGIAQVFDVGETSDGGAFLVMELVRGRSVRRKEVRELSHADLLRILREVARTLDAVHQAGLVHRDVKPDNIMIREDGRVVLLDFGIAKHLAKGPTAGAEEPDSVVTAQGTLMGTAPYVAPEQIRGKEVGPATDQFALGVVAFGFLTGKQPWQAPSDLGLLGQILMEPPFLATSVEASLPLAVNAVFERVLAKEAAKRYPSVEGFVDALEASLEPRAPGEVTPPDARPDEGAAPLVGGWPSHDPPLVVERGPTVEEAIARLRQARVQAGEAAMRSPSRSPWPFVLLALLLALVAGAVGVWYGRRARASAAAEGDRAAPGFARAG